MGFKKNNLYLIIFIAAVLGLFVVQYQYLNIGLNLAKVQFQKKIGDATTQIKQELSSQNQLTFLIGQAILKDNSYFTLSTDSIKDASRFFLQDFLTYKLTEQGIQKQFSYRLYSQGAQDYLSTPKQIPITDKNNVFSIQLEGYLPNLINNNLILELQFNNLNNYFLFQLNGLTIPSILFLLIIILVVIWVLKSFYNQQNRITTTNNFINNLTHELKTPVFSIGLATKILEKQANPKQIEVLNIIKQQNNRLNTHIDKVLELSALENKKKVIQLQKVDFKPHLEKLCEDFKLLSSLENLSFNYTICDSPLPIKAAISHLENAINNILENAKKYSENPIITLNAQVKNQKLIIAIKDNGRGISKKDLKLIFDKFYRVTKDNTHNVKGYGIGLNYVKEIMKQHKAKLHIESEINKGTTVFIELPVYET